MKSKISTAGQSAFGEARSQWQEQANQDGKSSAHKFKVNWPNWLARLRDVANASTGLGHKIHFNEFVACGGEFVIGLPD
jgi:hypothetical protein